jgi:alkyl hydroperoxide reductase subunit AhpC
MPGYNASLERFAGYDAQVVGSSVDSIYSHIAWQKKEIGVLNFPLASDFYPHGAVAKKFGIFREGDPIPGISERAIFIIGKDQKIAFSKVYPLDRVPEDEEIFEALRGLK